MVQRCLRLRLGASQREISRLINELSNFSVDGFKLLGFRDFFIQNLLTQLGQGVACLPSRNLIFGTVGSAGVSHVMPEPPVSEALQQSWPFATARPRNRFAGFFIHG